MHYHLSDGFLSFPTLWVGTTVMIYTPESIIALRIGIFYLFITLIYTRPGQVKEARVVF